MTPSWGGSRMKTSKRNLAKLAAKNAKLKAGRPVVSKYAAKKAPK